MSIDAVDQRLSFDIFFLVFTRKCDRGDFGDDSGERLLIAALGEPTGDLEIPETPVRAASMELLGDFESSVAAKSTDMSSADRERECTVRPLLRCTFLKNGMDLSSCGKVGERIAN